MAEKAQSAGQSLAHSRATPSEESRVQPFGTRSNWPGTSVPEGTSQTHCCLVPKVRVEQGWHPSRNPDRGEAVTVTEVAAEASGPSFFCWLILVTRARLQRWPATSSVSRKVNRRNDAEVGDPGPYWIAGYPEGLPGPNRRLCTSAGQGSLQSRNSGGLRSSARPDAWWAVLRETSYSWQGCYPPCSDGLAAAAACHRREPSCH